MTVRSVRNIMLFLGFVVFRIVAVPVIGDTIPCVQLKGFHGGDEIQLCVGSKGGNVGSVIIYSTPRDRKFAEDAAGCLRDAPDTVGGPTVYFVVNKKRVNIPTAIFRHMLKSRSAKYPHIIYCVDNEAMLSVKWKFDPADARIFILDESGVVILIAALPLEQSVCARLKHILDTIQ